MQSLTNLILTLEHFYDFSVLTTAYDLLSVQPYPNVKENSWNTVKLPGATTPLEVYFAGHGRPTSAELRSIISSVNPQIIYLNGIFSFRLFLLPLLFRKKLANEYETIVCPRGMLQQGALAVKSGKKRLYVKVLQSSGLLKKVKWHATTDDEQVDIKRYFPVNKGVFVAPNIPKTPYSEITIPEKKVGSIKLIYLSLITHKKNLHLLVEVLSEIKENVTLDIYGPVKDEDYWQECQQLIMGTKGRITYKGDIKPTEVQKVLSSYHALVLFTKGENFGHAIYESLSVGRPVITSHFTPWNDLQLQKAGDNVNIFDKENCKVAVLNFIRMDSNEYSEYCKSAHQAAITYYKSLNAANQYSKLFEVT